MRIAQIAPLLESVPPQLYGGTERVVAGLTDELVRRGHDVTLFASGDSDTLARLIPGAPTALRLSSDSIDKLALHIAMLATVEQMASRFDIIHNHLDYIAYPYLRHWRTPSVTTLHGRLDIPELPLLYARYPEVNYARYPEVNLVSISNSQRRPLEPFGLNWVGTVYNGMAHDSLSFQSQPCGDDYLIFPGRICEEKRPDLAVEVARRSGLRLKIAAKIDAVDRDWHHRVMLPLLDDPLVEFLGEVNDGDKRRLLGGAIALVFPSLWPEPFGLAMIEAMACGTPVIALRYGAVSEVVVHGETGFICESVDEMAACIDRIHEIDRQRCRLHVERHFSVEAMTDGYEHVYARIRMSDRQPFQSIPRQQARLVRRSLADVARRKEKAGIVDMTMPARNHSCPR